MDAVSKLDTALQQVLLNVGSVEITARVLILLAVLAALALAFVLVARGVYRTYLRNRFYRDYKIDLSRSVKIQGRRSNGANGFSLSFPEWLYPNKDGSRDRRRSNNTIVQESCVLLVDDYRVSVDSPIHLIWLVNTLRAKGVSINRCVEEERKYRYAMSQKELIQKHETILSLIGKFRERPADFENYCAQLFAHRGFRAVVTPPSRDGGYDIELWGNSGIEVIVECKCYDPGNKVGRDLIQKLVGANASLNAPQMMFVTTSDFSFDAKKYAASVGVELVNGEGLLCLVQEVFAVAEAEGAMATEEWELHREDLLQYYPPDYPPERFEV